MATCTASAAQLRTTDGQLVSGRVSLTKDAIVLVLTNETTRIIPLRDVQQLDVVEEPAPGTGPGSSPGLGLLGYYFPGTNSDGAPFVRLDETIDFDWADREPVPGLSPDRFHVVWSGAIEAPASGAFTFIVKADDRVQLELNGQSLIRVDGPRDVAESASAPVPMEQGKRYPVRLAYTDLSGPSRVRLLWSGPGVPRAVIPQRLLRPAGMGAGHEATFTTNQGLLATYYSGTEFTGSSFTRIDPTIDFEWMDKDPAPGFGRTNFSVRWTGLLLADHTEEYTFHALTDERVRLWIDNKLLMDRPEQAWLSENKESLPLVSGERYDLRIETRSTGGGAVARLYWASASVPRTNIPPNHLLPSRPSARGDAGFDAGNRPPPGIVCRNGSYLAGIVQQATPTALRMDGLLRGRSLSLVQVARILFQPLAPALAQRLAPGRTGVLLAKGDFVDGDFRSLENGRVSISSVLFGVRSFNTKNEALAVVLRDASPAAPVWEVRLKDRSVLLPRTLGLEPGGLRLDDIAAGLLRITLEDVAELKRRPAAATK